MRLETLKSFLEYRYPKLKTSAYHQANCIGYGVIIEIGRYDMMNGEGTDVISKFIEQERLFLKAIAPDYEPNKEELKFYKRLVNELKLEAPKQIEKREVNEHLKLYGL